MQLLIAASFCALVGGILARPEINQSAAEESRNRLKQAHKTCQSSPVTALDETVLEGTIKGVSARPANFGPHSFCISKAVGWQNEDGTINKTAVEKAAIAIYGNNDKVQELVTACTDSQSSAEETAIKLLACYKKNAPNVTTPSA